MASHPAVVVRNAADTGYPPTLAALMRHLSRDYTLVGRYHVNPNDYLAYKGKPGLKRIIAAR